MNDVKNILENLLSRNAASLWRVLGKTINFSSKTMAGQFLVKQTGKLAGASIVELGFYGVGKSDDIREIADGFARVMEAFGWKFERGKEDENEVEIFMLDCPGKLDSEEACLAGMEADRELVRRLGGELIIEETIATGEARCRMRVVRAR